MIKENKTYNDSPQPDLKKSDAIELLELVIGLESHTNQTTLLTKNIHDALFGSNLGKVEESGPEASGGLFPHLKRLLNSITDNTILNNEILSAIADSTSH
jgi:hypothetical protein